MKARAAAPTSSGSRMVRMRERSSGPGAKLTAELPAPSAQHSTKGIVKMPTRFVPTVSSSASAALPPTACSDDKPLHHAQHQEQTSREQQQMLLCTFQYTVHRKHIEHLVENCHNVFQTSGKSIGLG